MAVTITDVEEGVQIYKVGTHEIEFSTRPTGGHCSVHDSTECIRNLTEKQRDLIYQAGRNKHLKELAEA